nr:hydrogenase maturation nickel metallochaperone HypA [uncultured Caproiciproducens sp.]
MHDYHKAVDFLEEASAKAKAAGRSKVTKINILVGDDSGYSGESIQMYFDDLSKGTICEGTEMGIQQVKSKLRCPKCNELFERKRFDFGCPKCGTQGEPSEVGREVKIESIEMK